LHIRLKLRAETCTLYTRFLIWCWHGCNQPAVYLQHGYSAVQNEQQSIKEHQIESDLRSVHSLQFACRRLADQPKDLLGVRRVSMAASTALLALLTCASSLMVA
jgi:hypothetical protein